MCLCIGHKRHKILSFISLSSLKKKVQIVLINCCLFPRYWNTCTSNKMKNLRQNCCCCWCIVVSFVCNLKKYDKHSPSKCSNVAVCKQQFFSVPFKKIKLCIIFFLVCAMAAHFFSIMMTWVRVAWMKGGIGLHTHTHSMRRCFLWGHTWVWNVKWQRMKCDAERAEHGPLFFLEFFYWIITKEWQI